MMHHSRSSTAETASPAPSSSTTMKTSPFRSTSLSSTSTTTTTTTTTTSTIAMPPLSVGVPLLLLLSAVPREVQGACRFPPFLQRDAPWAASYGQDARLVMYVKETYMSVSQQGEHGDTKYTRKCEKEASADKFLVTHTEERGDARYLCMQFLQRSENIVQMKYSNLSSRQTLELCDEENMSVDRWPIVQMSQTPEQKIRCPFLGGYNVRMFYPNETMLCTESTLLMRMESECEQGEGVVFDFRQDECVPLSLPRTTRQQAYCIAHWRQANQTFIILQHAEIHKQTWCLRISESLSNMRSAYLMLDLVCDTSNLIKDTKNYFRLELSRRVYASTCEDEIESDVCQDMRHLCKSHFKRHCARTCHTCRSEKVKNCAFEETYRGLWMDSGQRADTQLNVGAYSLNLQQLGRYDCFRMEGPEKHKNKRVLVRIDENGCYPRYACAEMEKISSSVMRFRLGDRHHWPLPQARDRKDHVCAKENFLSRNAMESRYHVQRPPRVLVKQSQVNRVPCNLPKRLQNGITFRDEGQSCSGCLMFQPSVARDRFVMRPHNCTLERTGQSSVVAPHRLMSTIDFSCLAALTFYNNTYAVITKTKAPNPLGRYLCWIFTPDNRIKVIKAAETLLYQEEELLSQDLLQAHFTITRRDIHGHCRNVIAIAPSPDDGFPSAGWRGRVTPRGQASSTSVQDAAVTYRVREEEGADKTQVEEPPNTHELGHTLQGGDNNNGGVCAEARRTSLGLAVWALIVAAASQRWLR